MDTSSKILGILNLNKKINALRKKGKKIAFTNGCFDILHFGHVSYLEKAKKNDRVLIVGLNSDRSVSNIKGLTRPIVPQKGRARLLAALACVDFVTIFEEDTPLRCIEKIKPDILIKGADWKGKEIVGSSVVRSYGGRVEFIKYVDNFSTTDIIKTILEKCKK